MDHVLGPSGRNRRKPTDSRFGGAERAQVPLRIAGWDPSCGPARRKSDGGGMMGTPIRGTRTERPSSVVNVHPSPVHQGHRRARGRVFDAPHIASWERSPSCAGIGRSGLSDVRPERGGFIHRDPWRRNSARQDRQDQQRPGNADLVGDDGGRRTRCAAGPRRGAVRGYRRDA